MQRFLPVTNPFQGVPCPSGDIYIRVTTKQPEDEHWSQVQVRLEKL